MHTRRDKATEREEKVSERTRASKRASMRTHTWRKMEREKDAYRKGVSVRKKESDGTLFRVRACRPVL